VNGRSVESISLLKECHKTWTAWSGRPYDHVHNKPILKSRFFGPAHMDLALEFPLFMSDGLFFF
jgi:hypothetical protein